MEENFRFQRIEKLLHELEYEIARAYHEDDLPEDFKEGLALRRIIGHRNNEPLELVFFVKKCPFAHWNNEDVKYNGLKLVK